MRVKVIRPHLGTQGMANVGDILAVNELRARELEQRGLAVPLVTPAEMAALGNKGVADKSAARPTRTPPAGGPTGEAKLASSSPADPAPSKRRSRRRRAAPA